MLYSHGGENCHHIAACMICANNHHTSECPLSKTEKRPAVFTCFNCKKEGKERTDHSANDVNCPLRVTYLEKRARPSTNMYKKSNNQRSTSNHVLLPNPSANAHFINQQTTAQSNYVNGNSYASCVRENNDLFSIDELFNIFMSTLSDLQKCSTKIQQIQVVMSMVKYAHGLR